MKNSIRFFVLLAAMILLPGFNALLAMQKENVTVKALLKQYNNLPMPDPALNQAKARSMLEYLRSLEK